MKEAISFKIIWNSYGILSDFFKNSIAIALNGHKYVTIALKYVLNVSTYLEKELFSIYSFLSTFTSLEI